MTGTFYRLERDGIGPYNHPDATARDLCRTLPRTPGRNLDELTDGNPRHWRSGCHSLQDLHLHFAPVLPELIRRGFQAYAYTTDEDHLLSFGSECAAHIEELHPDGAVNVTADLLRLHGAHTNPHAAPLPDGY